MSWKDLGSDTKCAPASALFCAAAAALDAEYTLPGISQSVVITRMAGRTPVLKRSRSEVLRLMAQHGYFFKHRDAKRTSEELISGGYEQDTPAAIVYKASWPEEKVLNCTVKTLAQTAKEAGVTKTALYCSRQGFRWKV